MHEELGRRDRKRLATHQALRSCALDLVSRRGLDKVTIEDIAEAADVSVRTFFNHFPSKEDAVIGFDVDQAESLRQAVLDRPSDEPPLEALHMVMRGLAVEMAAGDTDWRRRMEIIRKIPDLAPRLLASFAACERALVEAVSHRIQPIGGASAGLLLRPGDCSITDPGSPGSSVADSGAPGSSLTDPGPPGGSLTDPGPPGSSLTDPGPPGSSIADPGPPGSSLTDPGNVPDDAPCPEDAAGGEVPAGADPAGALRAAGDLRPVLAALSSVAALRAAVLLWYDAGRQGSLPDLVDEAFALLEHGLSVLDGADSNRGVTKGAP